MKRLFATLMLAASCTVAWPAMRTVTLSVPGMDCPVCPLTVRAALERVPGVSSARIDFERRQARVSFDDARVDVAALMRATRDAGYPSTPVRE